METAQEQAPGKETSQGKGSRLRGGELQRCDQQGMTARAPRVSGAPSTHPLAGPLPRGWSVLSPPLTAEAERKIERRPARSSRAGRGCGPGSANSEACPRLHVLLSTSSPSVKKKKTGTHLVTVPHLSSPQSFLIKAKEAAKNTLYELDRG